MNLEQMRKEVENIVDDPSFDSETIDGYINECIGMAAAEVNLPTLKGVGIITTNSSYSISIAEIAGSNFNGILRKAIRADGFELTIHASIERLMEVYPMLDRVGSPTDCALEGTTLWYQGVPDDPMQLSLVFYKYPSLLSKNSDEPTDFPSHVHRKLFVNGTAWRMFDQIEDGLEGPKVNTAVHFSQSFKETERESGITKLREWLAKRRPHHICSVWRY